MPCGSWAIGFGEDGSGELEAVAAKLRAMPRIEKELKDHNKQEAIRILARGLLASMGENVLLIESNTSNPDVWKTYKEEVNTELIDLDQADGWIDLVNLCDSRPESVVVINTAARNNAGVSSYGETLTAPSGVETQAGDTLGDQPPAG